MKNLSIFEPQIEKHYAYKKKTCNLLTTEAANITKGFHMLLKVQDKLWRFPLKNTRDSCSVRNIPLITDIASL